MHSVRRWIDGYDAGILYADTHVGRLLEEMASLRVLDDAAIIVTADHGENQGELNIWGGHQTADHCTSRVPLIVRWPGITGRIERSLQYQFDWSATLIELVNEQVPEGWDGRSFMRSFKSGEDAGRSHLVLGQGAWTCQRAVRFGRWPLSVACGPITMAFTIFRQCLYSILSATLMNSMTLLRSSRRSWPAPWSCSWTGSSQ